MPSLLLSLSTPRWTSRYREELQFDICRAFISSHLCFTFQVAEPDPPPARAVFNPHHAVSGWESHQFLIRFLLIVGLTPLFSRNPSWRPRALKQLLPAGVSVPESLVQVSLWAAVWSPFRAPKALNSVQTFSVFIWLWEQAVRKIFGLGDPSYVLPCPHLFSLLTAGAVSLVTPKFLPIFFLPHFSSAGTPASSVSEGNLKLICTSDTNKLHWIFMGEGEIECILQVQLGWLPSYRIYTFLHDFPPPVCFLI